MVVHQPVTIETLAIRLIKVLEHHPGVREVWLTENRGDATFWVIVDPLDHAAELGLFEVTNILFDDYPGARWDLHLLNPVNYPEGYDLRKSIRAGARQLIPVCDE